MWRRRRNEAGLFVFLAVALTVACAKTYFVTLFALAAASPASGQTNLGKRVAIDVTEVAPQKVFELLAREP